MSFVSEFISKSERIDIDSKRDTTELYRKYSYILTIITQIIILILGVLTFTQMLGKHKGQNIPLNYPNHSGGWDISNNISRIIITIFSTLILMINMILINDPNNLPERFSLGYKESVIYSGFILRFISFGLVICGMLYSSFLNFNFRSIE